MLHIIRTSSLAQTRTVSAMRTTLLDQIIRRRQTLKIRSSDMPLLAGINRQQYEKIEKGGNPSLITLDKIAEGLDAELMLIPKEKMGEVRRVLADASATPVHPSKRMSGDTGLPGSASSQNSPGGMDADDDVADPWALIEHDGKNGS